MSDVVKFLSNIHKKDDWCTPKKLYDELNTKFHFTFDPCPVNPQFDGLHIKWHGSVFCNPPYSEVVKWIEKGINEIMDGNVSALVYLVYAKTDTRWFHTYFYNNDILDWDIEFIKGRVRFGNPELNDGKGMPAPFPSMLLKWRKKNDKN